MKILITNFALDVFRGSEVWCYAMASELKRRGQIVDIYTPMPGKFANEFEKLGCKFVKTGNYDLILDNHREVKKDKFSGFIIHTCHGIAYDDYVKTYETLGNVSNIEWIDRYLSEVGTHDLIIPEECSKCSATHCSICCVQSSKKSSKELPIDRWYDRTAQKNLCKYYQMFGIYDKAVHTILTNETVRGVL